MSVTDADIMRFCMPTLLAFFFGYCVSAPVPQHQQQRSPNYQQLLLSLEAAVCQESYIVQRSPQQQGSRLTGPQGRVATRPKRQKATGAQGRRDTGAQAHART